MPNARTFAKDVKAAGIASRDAEGRVVDLHALRGTFVSALAAGGTHPKVAQALARHSSVELTMRAYTDLALLDLRGAVEATALRVPEMCQQPVPSGPQEASPGPMPRAEGRGADRAQNTRKTPRSRTNSRR